MYLPAASWMPSFCQETLKNHGLQLLAGEQRRAGVGADQERLAVEHRRRHRQHHVGEHDAGHEVDVVALEQLLDQLPADIRVLLIVGDDHFGRQAAELAAARA